MEQIILNKDQIEKIIKLHDHFKHLQSFSIALEKDGDVAIKFKLSDLTTKRQTHFVQTIC